MLTWRHFKDTCKERRKAKVQDIQEGIFFYGKVENERYIFKFLHFGRK